MLSLDRSSCRIKNNYFGENTAAVIETINGTHQKGRIKAQGGVYWPAISVSNERIIQGDRVRLLCRQGNTWIVEHIDMPGTLPRQLTRQTEPVLPSQEAVRRSQPIVLKR